MPFKRNPGRVARVLGIAVVTTAIAAAAYPSSPAGAAAARTASSWLENGDCYQLIGVKTMSPTVSITPNFDGQFVEIYRQFQGFDGSRTWNLGHSDLLARVYNNYGLYGAAGSGTQLTLKKLSGYVSYSEEDYISFYMNGRWSSWQRMGLDQWC